MTKTSTDRTSTRVAGIAAPFGQASSLADVLIAAPASFLAMPHIAVGQPVAQWQTAFASVADGTMQAPATTAAHPAMAAIAVNAVKAATKRYAITTNHAVRGDKGSKPWGFPS